MKNISEKHPIWLSCQEPSYLGCNVAYERFQPCGQEKIFLVADVLLNCRNFERKMDHLASRRLDVTTETTTTHAVVIACCHQSLFFFFFALSRLECVENFNEKKVAWNIQSSISIG